MKNINNVSMHGEKFYQLHTETTTAVGTANIALMQLYFVYEFLLTSDN